MKLIFSLILPAIAGSLLSVAVSSAASLNQVQQQGTGKIAAAQDSQQKIDKIVAGAQQRLIEYRALRKQVDGLGVYNEQLSIQIAGQQDLIGRFDKSIKQVSLIERQMFPLVSKMAQALGEFVHLDLPFHVNERQQRLAVINDTLAAAEINIAEKFRQVIEAYQVEYEYGRKIDSYKDIVVLNGHETEVDVLRVGRVALVCQSKDTRVSARWDNDAKTWQTLDNANYRNGIRQGIKMAKKQAPIDLLLLPIVAPQTPSNDETAR